MALHKPVIKWGICIVKRPQKFDYQAFVVDMSKDLSFLRSRCSGNPLNVIIPAGTQLRESQCARARAKRQQSTPHHPSLNRATKAPGMDPSFIAQPSPAVSVVSSPSSANPTQALHRRRLDQVLNTPGLCSLQSTSQLRLYQVVLCPVTSSRCRENAFNNEPTRTTANIS